MDYVPQIGQSLAGNRQINTVGCGSICCHTRKNVTRNSGHSSLADALTAALTGNEIRLLDGSYAGPFTLDKGVVLKGGWNSSFSALTGVSTVLNGVVTVTAGESRLETADVDGKLQLRGGTLRGCKVRVN